MPHGCPNCAGEGRGWSGDVSRRDELWERFDPAGRRERAAGGRRRGRPRSTVILCRSGRAAGVARTLLAAAVQDSARKILASFCGPRFAACEWNVRVRQCEPSLPPTQTPLRFCVGVEAGTTRGGVVFACSFANGCCRCLKLGPAQKVTSLGLVKTKKLFKISHYIEYCVICIEY